MPLRITSAVSVFSTVSLENTMHLKIRNKIPVNRRSRPPVVHFTDDLNRPCVYVPLDAHGRNRAIALERDYEALQKAGATGVWRLNSNDKGQPYVRTCVPDGKGGATSVLVARLITGASARSTIYYVNKDRLDLRPENLFMHHKGKSKRCDIALAEEGARYRASRSVDRGLEVSQ